MKLGLGTVQFGLDYGVSNTQGRTPRDEVAYILGLAKSAGVSVLDTAALYGSSEEALGENLPADQSFKIVTKTAQFRRAKITSEDAQHLSNVFNDSLRKLGQNKVYGLLVHHADDLLAEGGEYLMEVMLVLKSRGLVEKIGVSMYSGEQIDRTLERYAIDLVQVPVNVFDQRLLVGGKLKQLKTSGIEIHARSLFLQGLLLMPVAHIAEYFAPLKKKIAAYHTYLQSQGLTMLQGALAFAASCQEIDEGILGVCSAQELRGILDAWHTLPQKPLDFGEFACSDERMINPSLWKLA